MNDIELAGLLRLEREYRGMSLRAAARAIGISNPYLSQLENGKVSNPALDVIQKISKVYAIRPAVWMRINANKAGK